MSESEDKENLKKVAKLRATIEQRIEAMEAELDELKTMLGLIDQTLIKEGFKRAELSQSPPPPTSTPVGEAPLQPTVVKQRKGVPLKTVTGELLAQIYTEKDSMQISLAEDKNFEINIPPFTSFFVERVLAKMQEKDREDVDKGKMTPERVLSYSIKRDGNRIQEITLNNLRPERFREIKSSIRWTLEKMYEKMKQNQ